MAIHDLSVARRMALIAGTGIAASLLTGAFAIKQLADINAAEVRLAEVSVPGMKLINEINDGLNKLREHELSYVIAATPEQLAEEEKAGRQIRAQIEQRVAAYAARISTDGEKRPWTAWPGR